MATTSHAHRPSWPYGRRDRSPGIRLAHRPLPHHGHDISLHMLDIPLQIGVLDAELALAPPVKYDPPANDENRQGHGDGEVHPQFLGDDRVGIYPESQ